MLHDGHQLDGVVAGLLHMGQDVVGELPVGTHLALFLAHADVGLVDVHPLLTLEVGVGPLELVQLVLDLGAPGDGVGILDHTAGEEGQMLGTGQVGVHHGLDLAAGPQGVVAGEVDLPGAAAQILQGVAGLVPVIEFAGQVQLVGTGGPFAVVPAAVNMMEAVVIVGVGKIIEGLAFAQDPILGCPVQEHPQVDVAGERLQLGVQFQKSVHDSVTPYCYLDESLVVRSYRFIIAQS